VSTITLSQCGIHTSTNISTIALIQSNFVLNNIAINASAGTNGLFIADSSGSIEGMTMSLQQLPASPRASFGINLACFDLGCTVNMSAVTFVNVVADVQIGIAGMYAVRMSDVVMRDALNTNGTCIVTAYTKTSTLDIARLTVSNMRNAAGAAGAAGDVAGVFAVPYNASAVGTLTITVDDALFDSIQGPAIGITLHRIIASI
jgi:hypothetical protein